MALNYWKIIVVISLLIGGYETAAQLSPGPLSVYHEHLEGLSNCTECHDIGKKVSNAKCLACHTEVKTRIDANKGYHASKEVKGKECASCHNDHHGKNFGIVRFDTAAFDHTLTGYALKGKHSKNSCADCHQSKFIQDEKIKKKQYSWLGMKTECLSCHEDYHQNTLSVSCTDCHDQEAFKPAPLFNHDKTKFPLKGAHQKQDCIECHKKSIKNGKEFQAFADIKHQNCTACHTDVHQNKFGPTCTDCHTENSFKSLKTGSRFNHDLTDFPLKGKHQQTDCKKCHTVDIKTPLKHQHCYDCHTDYHQGDLGAQRNCTECHDENSFKESSYTIENHQISSFPLEGAHLATPCFACHQKEERWRFREIGRNCKDCHQDVHQSSIKEMYYPKQNCRSCHGTETWHSVQFNHEQTGYVLEGAHLKQTCAKCHFEEQKPASFVFKPVKSACKSCHEEPHGGQFDFYGEQSCTHCHSGDSFKSNHFNHDLTKFPLEGKHKEAACSACHKPIQQNGIQFIEYKIKDYRCEACHSS